MLHIDHRAWFGADVTGDASETSASGKTPVVCPPRIPVLRRCHDQHGSVDRRQFVVRCWNLQSFDKRSMYGCGSACKTGSKAHHSWRGQLHNGKGRRDLQQQWQIQYINCGKRSNKEPQANTIRNAEASVAGRVKKLIKARPVRCRPAGNRSGNWLIPSKGKT